MIFFTHFKPIRLNYIIFFVGHICSCANFHSKVMYIKPGEKTRTVSWNTPELKCQPKPNVIPALTVNPDITSPHDFGPGMHNIKYTYTVDKNVTQCTVQIEVEGKSLSVHICISYIS